MCCVFNFFMGAGLVKKELCVYEGVYDVCVELCIEFLAFLL